MNWLSRTELLLGKENLAWLKKANVLIAGLGGVGAYAAEQLCRAGIGKMTIVDGDVVEATNRNRQLPALISNEGKLKTKILAARFREINPEIDLTVISEFLRDERTVEVLKSRHFDYIVDAIDTLSPKVFLIYHSLQLGYNVVSSMGSGGKTDPAKVQVADISQSYNCSLARMLRKRLSRLGVKKGVTVVFSPEPVTEKAVSLVEGQNKKSVVGTISYMPPVFGCYISSVVIKDLLSR